MKYFIVRKLDDADSELVNSIVGRINRIAKAVRWEDTKDCVAANYIIAVGGDGTMLQAMHLSLEHKVPTFGFNIGKVGYLAEFQPEKVEETIINIVHDRYEIDCRSVVIEKNLNLIAINEFAILPEMSNDTLKYEFFVNGVSSGRHHANGLLISTPTGSTAYSLSVGGSILQPNSGVFQITPVAAMSLNSRSIVVGDKAQLKVGIKVRKGKKYNLVADGQVVSQFEATENGVHSYLFGRHSSDATLLHDIEWNFFQVLQEKLHWNQIV